MKAACGPTVRSEQRILMEKSAFKVELVNYVVEILQLITVRSETGLQLSQEAPARLRSRNDA
jgi:hypothetical protein